MKTLLGIVAAGAIAFAGCSKKSDSPKLAENPANYKQPSSTEKLQENRQNPEGPGYDYYETYMKDANVAWWDETYWQNKINSNSSFSKENYGFKAKVHTHNYAYGTTWNYPIATMRWTHKSTGEKYSLVIENHGHELFLGDKIILSQYIDGPPTQDEQAFIDRFSQEVGKPSDLASRVKCLLHR